MVTDTVVDGCVIVEIIVTGLAEMNIEEGRAEEEMKLG